MAKHFYSFQFDMPYRSTYLRNWEVPKYYCPKPRRRYGYTRIISNNRGHLLPGEPRPVCNPFGDFIGTWEMPRKITREVANKLNGITDKPAFMEKCRHIASAPPRDLSKYNKKEKVQTTKEEPTKENQDKSNENIIMEESKQVEELQKIICPIHDF